MKRLLIASMFIMSSYIYTSAQSFTCDGTFYVSLYQGNPPTTFYEITTASGVNFDELFMVDLQVNGIGLSTVDQNIYGIAFQTNEVFRIEANGTATSVFSEPEIGTWNAAAGAVNNNGVYVVHDRNTDKIFLYQTGATVSKLGSVQLFWDASTGNTGLFDHNIDDLVFDPFDDTVMYTYQRFWDASGPVPTQGHLLRVNVDMTSPEFGMVSSVGLLDPNEIVHLGSLFFDTNGALHGYGANTSGPIVQERLVKINQNNADIELLGIGPQASGVDGCSCRNPMRLTKTAEIVETTCDSNYIKYNIEIENFSMLGSPPLKLKDTLSFEGTIVSFDFEGFDGSSLTSGGVGTDNFIFEEFMLDSIETVGFSFIVGTELSGVTVDNQARLYENIDQRPIDSDDPTTMEISDPTSIFLPIAGGDTEASISFDLCSGESVVINGMEYTIPGQYMDTLENEMGCDSLLTINILELPDTEGELSASICEGESVEINGVTYDMGGEYVQDLVNTFGCDSTLKITINEFEDTVRDEEVALCPGENIVINGETYDTPGFYVQELMNQAGCDSTINITVLVDGTCDDCLPNYTQNRSSISIIKTLTSTKLSINIEGQVYNAIPSNDSELNAHLMDFIQATRSEFSNVEMEIKCISIFDDIEQLQIGKKLVIR